MIYKRGDNYHMDVTIQGVRYRESLVTANWKAAKDKEKDRISEIMAGKGASKAGREFSRAPFSAAADAFLDFEALHVAPRTLRLHLDLLKPMRRFFGDKSLNRVTAADVFAYQKKRLSDKVSNRTVNLEVGVLRLMLKRGKAWSMVAEDVKMLPERRGVIGRVLTSVQKQTLFETASQKPEWEVAYCAAVLAVSTTCRSVELKHLRWKDVDLFNRVATIHRSKTQAGLRTITLNSDALASLARLRKRAEKLSGVEPDHYVFPACERLSFDPTRPQATWRTAWRSLVAATARRAGREAAYGSLSGYPSIERAKEAYRAAVKTFKGLRFHDLRHQAITELAEAGNSDATIMALAGHVSREMMEHYTHVRLAAKRTATDALACGLISVPEGEDSAASEAIQ